MSKVNKIPIIILIFLSGCSNDSATDKMPEVNNENCKRESIMKIEPESLRNDFGSKCIRKNGFRETSNPQSWGDI